MFSFRVFLLVSLSLSNCFIISRNSPLCLSVCLNIMSAFSRHGVEILEPNAASSSNRSFRGTGYKLGRENEETEVVPGAAVPKPPAEVTLRLWRDGFSVDDGELREYADPANTEFLNSIRRGEIPQELRQGTTEVSPWSY